MRGPTEPGQVAQVLAVNFRTLADVIEALDTDPPESSFDVDHYVNSLGEHRETGDRLLVRRLAVGSLDMESRVPGSLFSTALRTITRRATATPRRAAALAS